VPRFFCAVALRSGDTLVLPAGAARHVQVLRMQPGEALTLFDGSGGEYAATVERMGRTELGVASIQPLMSAHGVLRLSGERAEKKRAHWEAIAIAACEQCGRNRVPVVHPVRSFGDWIGAADIATGPDTGTAPQRLVLSLAAGTVGIDRLAATRIADAEPPARAWRVLRGPEGGLSAGEEARALAEGFVPVTLGTRVLRAETAGLAALVSLTSPLARAGA
jgi:16S rRNA (uracil1498-N3)-methyltransferase